MKQIKKWLAYALVFTMLVGSVPMEGLATEITVSGNEDIVLEEVEETVSDNSTVSGNESVSDNTESTEEIPQESVSDNNEPVEIGDAVVGEDVSENAEQEEFTVSGNEEITSTTITATSSSYMDSGILDRAGRSKGSMRYLYNKVGTLTTADLYKVTPSYKYPYNPGSLTDKNQNNALAYLNYIRYVAGLNPTVLNADLANQAQYGAVLLAATGTLSHTPSRPSDMTTEFYNIGYASTTSSNIGMGYTYLNDHIKGCLGDNSGANNLLCVGHRRWLLNPKLYNVGFGQAGSFTVTQVFDTKGQEGDYNFIAWPSSGDFPKELFSGFTPWSITLNPNKYKVGKDDFKNIKVTLKCTDTGSTDTFTMSNKVTNPTSSTKYLSVNTDGYGISNCVIFNTGAALPGNNYEVTVSGIYKKDGTATEIKYKVNMFDITTVKPSCMTINPTSMSLTLGEGGCEIDSKQSISITENALFGTSDQTITWTSSKTSVATVSTAGKSGYDTHDATITIKGVGTTTITAKNKEGSTATCVVKVYRINPNTKLQGEFRKIDNNGVEGFQIGERFFLEIFKSGTYDTVSPVKYDADWFVFKSSDSEKAAIDKYGQVTMISPGKVTITASLDKDPDGRKVSKEITVLKKQVAAMDFTWDRVALPNNEVVLDYQKVNSNGSVSNRKGEKHQIGVTAFAIQGEKITDTGFTFSSTDTSVAKVSSAGEVTFVGPGTCSIKVTAKDTHKYNELIKIVLKEYTPRVDKTSITFNQAHAENDDNQLMLYQAYNTKLPGTAGTRYDEADMERFGIRISDAGEGLFKVVGYQRVSSGAIFIFDTAEDTKETKTGKMTISIPVTMENNSTEQYSFDVSLKATYSVPSSSIKASDINLNILTEYGRDFEDSGVLKITAPKQTKVEDVEFVPAVDTGDEINKQPFEVEGTYFEYVEKNQKITYSYKYGAKKALLTYLNDLNATTEKEVISAINRDYKVLVYYEGYDMPYEKNVKVKAVANAAEVSIANKDGIFYQIPATLRNEILLKDSDGNQNSIPIQPVKVLVNKQEITVENGVANGSQFKVSGGDKVVIFANSNAGVDKKKYNFQITVASERLLLPYTYSYKTTVKEEPTKITASKKKVTIYRDKEETAQNIKLYVKGQSEAVISELTQEVVFKKQLVNDSPFRITYNGQDVVIDLVDGKAVEAGTYKINFNAKFQYMVDSQTKITFDKLEPISISVVVSATVPKAKLSKKTVVLDKYIAKDAQELTLTDVSKLKAGYGDKYKAVYSIPCSDVVDKAPLVSLDESGKIKVSFGNTPSTEYTARKYTYRFEPELVSEDGQHICKLPGVTLTVQVKGDTPQISLKASTVYMTVRQKSLQDATTSIVFTNGGDYGKFDVAKTTITYEPAKSTYRNATANQIPKVSINENGVITAEKGSEMPIKEATYVYTIKSYLASGVALASKTLKVQVTGEMLTYKVSSKGSIHLNNRAESGIDFTFKTNKNHAKPINAYLEDNSLFTIVKQTNGNNFKELYNGSVVVRVRAKTVEELTAMYAQTGGSNTSLEEAKNLALRAFKKKDNPVQITVIMDNGDVLFSGKKMIAVKQDTLKGKVTGQATLFEGVNNSKATVKVELTSPKDKNTGELKYQLDHVSSKMTADQEKAFGYALKVDENGVGYLTISLDNTGIVKANKTYKLKFLLQGENNSGDGGATVTVSVKLKK